MGWQNAQCAWRESGEIHGGSPRRHADAVFIPQLEPCLRIAGDTRLGIGRPDFKNCLLVVPRLGGDACDKGTSADQCTDSKDFSYSLHHDNPPSEVGTIKFVCHIPHVIIDMYQTAVCVWP
jgi:hypothetical protein